MSQAATILKAALQLDEAEREDLVLALSCSLHSKDLGAEWEGEIRRRVEAIDAGEVDLLEGEDVFSRLEKRFGGR